MKLNHLFEAFMTHFELILTIAVAVCMVFYVIDAFTFAGERKRLLKRLKSGSADATDRQDYYMRLEQAERSGIKKKHLPLLANIREALEGGVKLSGSQLYWVKKPVYPLEKFIEFFSGMFWILFIIWFLRSFLYEPYRIPSGSMEPTLYAGDFILTSKYAYGVRLPVLRTKIIETGKVQRGDVIVFRYPRNPSLNYIKRVVGLPGDNIRYENGRIWINDEEQQFEFTGETRQVEREYLAKKYRILGAIYKETLGERQHFAQIYPELPNKRPGMDRGSLTVPAGHYFVMGDNRDDSEDSRAWGLVDDELVVGKALFIWMNSDCLTGNGQCGRIGNGIH